MRVMVIAFFAVSSLAFAKHAPKPLPATMESAWADYHEARASQADVLNQAAMQKQQIDQQAAAKVQALQLEVEKAADKLREFCKDQAGTTPGKDPKTGKRGCIAPEKPPEAKPKEAPVTPEAK